MPGVWVFPGGVVTTRTDRGRGRGGPPRLRGARAREEAGIELPEDELLPGRAGSLRSLPVRFDTRFYVALAPRPLAAQARRSRDDDAGWYRAAERPGLHGPRPA